MAGTGPWINKDVTQHQIGMHQSNVTILQIRRRITLKGGQKKGPDGGLAYSQVPPFFWPLNAD